MKDSNSLSQLIMRCYNPYTSKTDFAIVECDTGNFYVGVRIENQVYPLTIEAPQAAIGIAFSELQMPVKLHIWQDEETTLSRVAKIYAEAFHLELLIHKRNMPIPSIERPKILSKEWELEQIIWPNKEKTVSESGFQVGCLLETELGFIHGFNFEHPYLSLGLCAERVALAKAISNGFSIKNEIHIFNINNVKSTPCGSCRQVIYEHSNANLTAYLHTLHKSEFGIKWTEFLPFPFQLKT